MRSRVSSLPQISCHQQVTNLDNRALCAIEESVYADPVRKVQEQLYQQLIAIREGMHQTIQTALTEVAQAQGSGAQPAAQAK